MTIKKEFIRRALTTHTNGKRTHAYGLQVGLRRKNIKLSLTFLQLLIGLKRRIFTTISRHVPLKKERKKEDEDWKKKKR